MSMGLDASHLYAEQSAFWLAAWASDAALTTLMMALRQHGLEATVEDAFLKISGRTRDEVVGILALFDREGLPSIAELLGQASFPAEQKFDPFVPDDLLRGSFGVRHLDRDEASRVVTLILHEA